MMMWQLAHRRKDWLLGSCEVRSQWRFLNFRLNFARYSESRFELFDEHFGRKVCVHRKGATSAKLDEIGIIPGSMGTASYIVRGLGNPESFMSCSHGAGRRMSRVAASMNLTVEECDKAMEGIVCE